MLFDLCKFRVVVKLTNKEKRAAETKKRFMLLSHKHSTRWTDNMDPSHATAVKERFILISCRPAFESRSVQIV